MLACSRREAEQYIEGGITVDGVVVEEPQFRVDNQSECVASPGRQPAGLTPVTILLHKLAGLRGASRRVSANASRWQHRRAAADGRQPCP
jgi:23S rRNA pseudouridine2604 synthase